LVIKLFSFEFFVEKSFTTIIKITKHLVAFTVAAITVAMFCIVKSSSFRKMSCLVSVVEPRFWKVSYQERMVPNHVSTSTYQVLGSTQISIVIAFFAIGVNAKLYISVLMHVSAEYAYLWPTTYKCCLLAHIYSSWWSSTVSLFSIQW